MFPASPGDLVFFSGRDKVNRLIQLGTCGCLSHVGIVFEHKGQLAICESTTLGSHPCAIQGKVVPGLQAQWVQQRVERYRGRVYVAPLKRPLSYGERLDLSEWCERAIRRGVPYDLRQAIKSALLSRRLFGLGKEDAHAVFCSEVVALALEAVDRIQFVNASGLPPATLYRRLRSWNVIHRKTRWK